MALSAIDWYSSSDNPFGCFSFRVGKGLLVASRVGKTSSANEAEGDERDLEVWAFARLARFVYLRFTRGSEEGTGVEGLRAAGVNVGGCAGDDALRFTADSLRSLAGRTLF